MDILKELTQSGFIFSKRYGQNFITDTNLLRAIVSDAGLSKDDTVIEVGAGAGTLTRELCAAAGRVTAFEIDERLKGTLDAALSDCSNARVIYKDILKTRLSEIEEICGGGYKVVANLPYYITTPVIFYFLNHRTHCKSLTLMMQKEVAERLTAAAGTPEYGAITAQVRVLGGAVLMRTVNRNMFTPRPNVDSAVVRIDINPMAGVRDYPILKRVIAAAFEMRRKTLVNNLIKSFALTRETASELMSKCGLDVNARGEVLDAEDFIKLSNAICGLKHMSI